MVSAVNGRRDGKYRQAILQVRQSPTKAIFFPASPASPTQNHPAQTGLEDKIQEQ